MTDASMTDVSMTDVSMTDVSMTDVSMTDVAMTDVSMTDVSMTDVAASTRSGSSPRVGFTLAALVTFALLGLDARPGFAQTMEPAPTPNPQGAPEAPVDEPAPPPDLSPDPAPSVPAPAQALGDGDEADDGADDEAPATLTEPPAPTRSALPAESAPVIDVQLSPESGLMTGDVLRVTLRVTTAARDDVTIPRGQSFAPFEVLGREDPRVQVEGDRATHVFELDLIALEPGDAELPAITLRVVTAAGVVGEAQTAPLRVSIGSVLGNEPNAEPKPPTDPVEVWEDDYTLAWVLGGLGLVLLGALFAWLLARWWRRRARAAAPPPPPRPPWEVALEKLEALRLGRDAAFREDRMVEWVDGVSDALREYLGGRYEFDGLESTTDEVISELRRRKLIGLSLDEVIALLRDCDLVKFAKATLDADQCDALLAGAFRVVRTSAPIAGAAAAEAPAPASAPTSGQRPAPRAPTTPPPTGEERWMPRAPDASPTSEAVAPAPSATAPDATAAESLQAAAPAPPQAAAPHAAAPAAPAPPQAAAPHAAAPAAPAPPQATTPQPTAPAAPQATTPHPTAPTAAPHAAPGAARPIPATLPPTDMRAPSRPIPATLPPTDLRPPARPIPETIPPAIGTATIPESRIPALHDPDAPSGGPRATRPGWKDPLADGTSAGAATADPTPADPANADDDEEGRS